SLLVGESAEACATAPPEGIAIRVAAEEAIVIWDSARKIEHFVRRAQFETTAQSFGFLVPTPNLPTLAEADDAAFERVRDAIAPEIRDQPRWEVGLPLCMNL